MTIRTTHPRVVTPVIALVAGTAIACAVGIRETWGAAIASEAIAVFWSAALYSMGGDDSDTGSIIGSRDDERQQLIALQAARLSLLVVVAAVVVLCLVAAAARYQIWPFQALLIIIGIAYFTGLRAYGMNSDRSPGGSFSRFGFRQDQTPS